VRVFAGATDPGGWTSDILASVRRTIVIAVLLLGGCRVDEAPGEPVADHVALCCKASEGVLSFRGCRVARSCRASESIVVRGPVECGVASAERCAGGRCCTIVLPERADALVGTPIVETPPSPPRTNPDPLPIVPQPFE
jgi:hypothetical protein